MEFVKIDAFDLDDAWFQCLNSIIDHGHIYEITRGSYKGQKRLEFDMVFIQVASPGHQIIPLIPEGMSIPPPTSMAYIEQYMTYILTSAKSIQEDYTYGERLVEPAVWKPVVVEPKIDKRQRFFSFYSPALKSVSRDRRYTRMPLSVNQILEVIRIYKEDGFGTNQAIMEIGMPSDIVLDDPPCLRLIDTRVRYGKLHFFCYFRSWDLWGGMPSNLGAIQKLKEWMAEEIGVEDGELMACSKGLHLYDHCWSYAELRTGKKITLEGRPVVK